MLHGHDYHDKEVKYENDETVDMCAQSVSAFTYWTLNLLYESKLYLTDI